MEVPALLLNLWCLYSQQVPGLPVGTTRGQTEIVSTLLQLKVNMFPSITAFSAPHSNSVFSSCPDHFNWSNLYILEAILEHLNVLWTKTRACKFKTVTLWKRRSVLKWICSDMALNGWCEATVSPCSSVINHTQKLDMNTHHVLVYT